jgi:pSer/pThr/pTyr-binding forkhead associated (FHA) protein
MACITVSSVDGEQRYYPLGKATVIIGRGEQVKVQIVDDMVSQKHVHIRFDPTEEIYYLLDLKSKNGTRVNSVPLHDELRLRDGDHIELGMSSVTFHDRDFPDRTDAFLLHKKPGERSRTTQME